MAEEIFSSLKRCVINMDVTGAKKAAEDVLKKGIDPYDALTKGLVPGMEVVSDKYEKKEIFLPQVLASASAFYAAFELLRPRIMERGGAIGKGIVTIGVVEGDIHDIGKNIVKTMLEANGFICHDLGRDVICEDFVEKARETNSHIVAMSTLMTPTLESMRRVTNLLVEEGIRDKLAIIIGGGSPSPEFAKEIGADAYGKDDKEAVKLAEEMAEKVKKRGE
ncbi:MAG: corrinoid protein [Candidatus Bathyarchaeia archaeon]